MEIITLCFPENIFTFSKFQNLKIWSVISWDFFRIMN
ncbi:hypothetical protein [Chryseobacterium sp. RU37D]